MELSLEEGKELVLLARKTVKHFFETGTLLEEKASQKNLMEKRGVFVTILNWPGKELRGCIGFPLPTKPLWNAVKQASLSAAFEDPRFVPLAEEELNKVIFEISILSMPEEINEKEKLLNELRIGWDGLIVRQGMESGLLLPKVAVELKWNARQFIEACCEKAFLPSDAWTQPNTKVMKFQAQVFTEEKPAGKIIKEKGGAE